MSARPVPPPDPTGERMAALERQMAALLAAMERQIPALLEVAERLSGLMSAAIARSSALRPPTVYTPEREALGRRMRAEGAAWPEVHAALSALPGHPIGQDGLAKHATAARWPAPARVPLPPVEAAMVLGPARKARLRELLEQDAAWPDIQAALNAMPGRPIAKISTLQTFASRWGFKRPPRPAVAAIVAESPGAPWTEAQKAALRRDYPTDKPFRDVVAAVNAAGPARTPDQVSAYASTQLKLRRPDGLRAAAAPTPPSAPTIDQRSPVPKPVAAPAPPKAPPAGQRPTAPKAVPRPAVEAEVAAFIARRGVTKCPTAFAEVSAGQLTEAERAALKKHGDPVYDSIVAKRNARLTSAARGAARSAQARRS